MDRDDLACFGSSVVAEDHRFIAPDAPLHA